MAGDNPEYFVKVPVWILKTNVLTTTEKILWLILKSYCPFNGESKCYPSIAKISREIGMDDRHVRRLLNGMVKKKFLSVKLRPGITTLFNVLEPLTYRPRVSTPRVLVSGDPGRTGQDTLGVQTPLKRTRYQNKVPEQSSRSKTDPRIKIILDYFHDRHFETKGIKPHILGGRDATAIKRMLNTCSEVEEFKARINRYLEDPLDWQTGGKQWTITGLEKGFTKYAKEREKRPWEES